MCKCIFVVWVYRGSSGIGNVFDVEIKVVACSQHSVTYLGVSGDFS
jgi:hypothetical protein